MPLEAKTRLGPYEILSSLGAGGMGEVYKARDTRLGREVAVKVISDRLGTDPSVLARFEREAKAVAALSHPNILAIFDFGEAAGVTYAVMELLEGATLRETLSGGPLPVSRATEIASQIARGLAAAHDKGIVHRDLKPENVFVTKDGRIKVLDFGLAKLTNPEEAGQGSQVATGSLHTGAGSVLGTVGYMSPEQVRGTRADARSDIFALGIVLSEMLSGHRPFERGSAMDTLAAILKEDPPPLPEGLPQSLDRIVYRCLQKQPEDRFHSAHDLAHDLEMIHRDTASRSPVEIAVPGRRRPPAMLALAAAAVLIAAGIIALYIKFAHPGTRPTKPPRIVILPFENLGAPEDAYFAAGMTEEITSRLANVRGLGVISRTSAVGYDRKGKTLKQIGSDLGVDYVLEGSVRWERSQDRQSRVRITPQLISVADDTHVWSERYDRVIADVFALQTEVAESAVKAMGITLLPREQSALKEVLTGDLEAYDLYLHGQAATSRSDSRKDMEDAVRMYQAAVNRDPRFAQALAGLAWNHVRMYLYYYDRSRERLDLAKQAADRAVELRPDLAETHTALGYYYYQGLMDFPRALPEFEAALAIQPNSSWALAGVAYVIRRQGRWAEGAAEMAKAVELDPKNPALLDNYGVTLVLARRYADADRVLGQAIASNPQAERSYAFKALLLIGWRGDMEGAQAVLEEGARATGSGGDFAELGGYALWYCLMRQDFPRALKRLEEDPPKGLLSGQFTNSPISLLKGEAELLAGRDDVARDDFEAARGDLEQRVARSPDDGRAHSALGIAYAGLGRKTEAVREARRGCELSPASRDALVALRRREDLARVYTMVGQAGEAIAELERLLDNNGLITPYVLQLDPRWDPLRPDPRFKALLRKHEVKS